MYCFQCSGAVCVEFLCAFGGCYLSLITNHLVQMNTFQRCRYRIMTM